MSRIGIQPIVIPEGVDVKIEDNGKLGGQKVIVKGPLGELLEEFRQGINCKVEKDKIVLERKSESKKVRSLHGLYRTLIDNMIVGVTKGYEKDLEMVGIGFRAELKGNSLHLDAGATHPFVFDPPPGISFEVNDKVNIKVKGTDKQLVGQLAARIRSVHKPEPYQGKGIRYKGEYVRRKAGKAAKAAEGAE
ncbi:50S ribosomal protein L6 [Candidatus Dojkabacteria bacterium]|nr:50S ribosomal protein L6 [Candidatus Dojkabacteria bacterium]